MALGLERVGEVFDRLQLDRPAPTVITVAGTNGKGSSCAFLSAILRASGKTVGTFSSPHLFRFNERISTDGQPISDRRLISALERVEQARAEIPLTYFEYAALAAMVEFSRCAVDVAVLEVGLGGRLDAVNVVDPDVALITNIGMDHMQWLGNTLDDIALEKAGILRPGQVAICAQTHAPSALHKRAAELGTRWAVADRDYHWQSNADSWRWSFGDMALERLPLPTLPGEHQLTNAAGALAALHCGGLLPAQKSVQKGLLRAAIQGRLWQVAENPEVIFDVGHNPAAAAVIRRWLATHPCKGRTTLIIGMLKDKDAQGLVAELAPAVDRWVFCGLPGGRGRSARQLRGAVRIPGLTARLAAGPGQALDQCLKQANASDRLLVLGSFVTVELAAQHLGLS